MVNAVINIRDISVHIQTVNIFLHLHKTSCLFILCLNQSLGRSSREEIYFLASISVYTFDLLIVEIDVIECVKTAFMKAQVLHDFTVTLLVQYHIFTGSFGPCLVHCSIINPARLNKHSRCNLHGYLCISQTVEIQDQVTLSSLPTLQFSSFLHSSFFSTTQPVQNSTRLYLLKYVIHRMNQCTVM